MNRSELRSEVLENSFSETAYATRCNRYLNDALGIISRRVTALQRLATLELSTVAGQETIDLPSDFIRLKWLSYPNARDVLPEVDEEDFEERPDSTGLPELFCFGSSASGSSAPVTITPALRLWPTPSSVVELHLRYTAGLPKLTQDTHEPAIPDDYHHLLVTFARSRCFRAEDDLEMADYYMREFLSDVAQMRSDLSRPSRSKRHRTPGMYSKPEGRVLRRPTA